MGRGGRNRGGFRGRGRGNGGGSGSGSGGGGGSSSSRGNSHGGSGRGGNNNRRSGGWGGHHIDDYTRGLGYLHDEEPHEFSLREEARYTERHPQHWGNPLRHSRITFVSAGVMDPTVLLKPAEQPRQTEQGVAEEISDEREENVDMAEESNSLEEPGASAKPDADDTRMDEVIDPPDPNTGPDQPEASVNSTDVLGEMDVNKVHIHTTKKFKETTDVTIKEPSEDTPFVVDVLVNQRKSMRVERHPGFALRPQSRPASPSSGEEIVFVPRKKRPKSKFLVRPKSRSRSSSPAQSPAPQGAPPPFEVSRNVVTVINGSVQVFSTQAELDTDEDGPKPKQQAKPPSMAGPMNGIEDSAPVVVDEDEELEQENKLPTKAQERKQSKPPTRAKFKMGKKAQKRAAHKDKLARNAARALGEDDVDDEIVADYIANTDMSELLVFDYGPAARDLGGDNMDLWESTSDDGEDEDEDGDEQEGKEKEEEEEVATKTAIEAGEEWDEFALADFDALSTSDEGKGVVEKILRSRRRPSGLQYLVKWKNFDTDEATWIIAENLDSTADEPIGIFEAKQRALATAHAESTSGSSDESDEDEGDEDESDEDDDQALREKKAQEEADFKLARIIAGLDSDDELDMDYGFYSEDDDGMELDDFFVRKAGGAIGINPRGKKGKFPSATRLANAIADEWDPMDWATPRNVAPKKGKKGKNRQWNISDEELEDQVRSTWEKDRLAKKAKKAERAALRSEGLLGGKKNKKAKYSGGIEASELHQKLMDFLMSDRDSLSLPPMSKTARKTVHNIAHAFNLTSKSFGSGRNRFPMLYKTSRTDIFFGDAELIRRTLSRFDKNYLPRGDRTPNKGRNSGGGGSGGHTHRDGDMVGGSAPELGIDNKGRQMLEKMGYKPGMALGAAGSNGIVAPILAVVKTTRAGLG